MATKRPSLGRGLEALLGGSTAASPEAIDSEAPPAPRGEEDFGQTFGHWGIPQGPYLFIPLFGPTTFRDGTGAGIRIWLAPLRQLNPIPRDVLFGLGYLDVRSQLLETQGLAAKAALDPYTFLRRSYLQRREYLTYDGQPPPRKDDDE